MTGSAWLETNEVLSVENEPDSLFRNEHPIVKCFSRSKCLPLNAIAVSTCLFLLPTPKPHDLAFPINFHSTMCYLSVIF